MKHVYHVWGDGTLSFRGLGKACSVWGLVTRVATPQTASSKLLSSKHHQLPLGLTGWVPSVCLHVVCKVSANIPYSCGSSFSFQVPPFPHACWCSVIRGSSQRLNLLMSRSVWLQGLLAGVAVSCMAKWNHTSCCESTKGGRFFLLYCHSPSCVAFLNVIFIL